jgi:hypothetical protein
MEVLTIPIEERQAGNVCAVCVQRSYRCLVGGGESETGRKGVKREGKRGQHHCVGAIGAAR